MAERKIYIGSVGPLLYDDTDLIEDSDGDFAGKTYGALISDGDLLFPNGTLEINKLKVTVTTGTAPLEVTSTTLVSNLNADLLDGEHAAAFADAVHTHDLGDMTDVDLTDIGADKILKYNAVSSHWECEDEAAGGAVAMADLTDVDLSDIADNKILQYKTLTSTWECESLPAGGALALDDITDVAITSVEKGDVLYYDGSNWVNLNHGTSGQVLTSGGHAANPSWETPTPGGGGGDFLVMQVFS